MTIADFSGTKLREYRLGRGNSTYASLRADEGGSGDQVDNLGDGERRDVVQLFVVRGVEVDQFHDA